MAAIPPLRGGHSVRLLEGAVEFFPALVNAIDGAAHEVRMETYIFDFTGSSVEVAYALERAARRGASMASTSAGKKSALPCSSCRPWPPRRGGTR